MNRKKVENKPAVLLKLATTVSRGKTKSKHTCNVANKHSKTMSPHNYGRYGRLKLNQKLDCKLRWIFTMDSLGCYFTVSFRFSSI